MIDKVLKIAAGQIGIKENPSGSNKVKYNTDYYGREVSGSKYPWCCVYIWWIFKKSGLSSLFYNGKKTAYCPTVENYYKSKGQWHSTGKRGDLVLFDFNGKGVAGHIGIVEKVNADGTYTTIEGNTSAGNDANGGMVMRRTRNKSVIRGFARPNYNNESAKTVKEAKTVNITLNQLTKGDKGKQVMTLQRMLIAFGYGVGKSGIDGDFGDATLEAVKRFQKGNGLTVDGIVGENTWTKLLK